jgi:ABC-type sugar transport system permease subunit
MTVTSIATRGRSTKRRRARTRWFDWLALPTLVVLAIVIGYPIFRAVQRSFYHYNLLAGSASASYVGAGNYQKLVSDPVFWQSLINTLIYTAASILIAGFIGLVLALATENLGGGWRWLRGVLLTPWAIPVIVVSFLFRYMLQSRGGIVNEILLDTGVINTPVPWLTSTQWALASVTMANIWWEAPFFLLLFTAALQGVPTEVTEAARIDRAPWWSVICQIKLPYLVGAAAVGSLLMSIQNFNLFPLIWAMTKGGPGYSTSTLVIYVYREAFTKFDLGYASTIGIVWLVLLLFIAALFIRVMRRGGQSS